MRALPSARLNLLKYAAPALLSALALSLPALADAQMAALPGGIHRAAPAAAAADLPLPADYVLSPDDQLEISVLGHEDYHAAVTILPDGSFRYQGVGSVHAAGLTIDQLTRRLTQGLSVNLNQPQVTVYLRQGRPRNVSVVGDGAKATGQYPFRTGMHLLDLLTAAGGPAEEATLVQATLVPAGGGPSLPINLPAMLTGKDNSQNLPLQPGDVLFLTARNPEVAQVQVVGDVGKPGAYPVMPDGISVLALLNNAGGALPTAKLTEAQIMHNGQVQVFNLRPLLTTDLNAVAGKMRLLPGDVLLVPANKDRVLALGEVRTPGILGIPDDQPLTLTTAYALVGGATPDGDKRNVDIVRRDPAGKTMLLAFNMEDLLKGKNGMTDIPMQPDDILFIQTRNHPKSVGDILSSVGSVASFGYAARLLGL